MADARHVEFSPFCDDAQQALLDERFLFFLFATFISKKKNTRGRIYPTREGWRLCLCFLRYAVFWATVQQKVLLLRRCRIVHVFSEVSFSGSILGFSTTTTTTTTTMTTNDDEGGPADIVNACPDMDDSMLARDLDRVVASGTRRLSRGSESLMGIFWWLKYLIFSLAHSLFSGFGALFLAACGLVQGDFRCWRDRSV